jgi:O-antigen/teichoic acid export membrane protein
MATSRGRTLILGQLLGQAAQLAVVPVLSRAFPPSEYGHLQTATAIAVLLLPVATLRLEFMIPVRSWEDAVAMTRLGYATSVGAGALCGLAAVLAAVTGSEAWQQVLTMVAVVLCAQAWIILDNAWLIRDGELNRLGARNAIAGTATAALQLAVAHFDLPIVYLALAMFAGRLIAAAVTFRRRPTTPEPDRPIRSDPYTLGRATSTIAAGILSSASVQSLLLFCAALMGPAEAGIVGMALRIAGLPVVLIGQSLSQYVQAKTATKLDREQLGPLVRQLSGQLSILGLVTAVPMLLLAPLVATPLLGNEWQGTGTVIALLAVPLGLQVVMSPLAVLFITLNRSSQLLALQTFRLVLATALAAIALAMGGGLQLVVAFHSLGTSVAYVMLWFFLKRAVESPR